MGSYSHAVRAICRGFFGVSEKVFHDWNTFLCVPCVTGLGTCLGMSNVLRLGMSRLPGLLMTRLRMDDVVPLGMWLRVRHGFRLGRVPCRA